MVTHPPVTGVDVDADDRMSSAWRGVRWSGPGGRRLRDRLSVGATSGQISSTRQGAWSRTKRAAGPRLRGPSRSRSPSRARTRMSMPSAAATTSRSTRPRRASSVAGRPSRAWASASSAWAACSEMACSGSGAAGGGAWRPSRPRRAAAGDGFGLGARNVQQRDLGVAGQQRVGLGDGGLPGVLDDPDERAHIGQTCRANHSSTVAATRPAGTVSAPRRRNSPSSTSVSSARRTRRHSSVASEPT